MGCLTATYRRIGAVTASLAKEGSLVVCLAERIPEGCGGSFDRSFDFSFERYYVPQFDMSFDRSFAIPFVPLEGWFTKVGKMEAEARRTGGMKAEIALVCDTGLTQYVRVEPKYIWLVPELDFAADTEVYSNVEWIVT